MLAQYGDNSHADHDQLTEMANLVVVLHSFEVCAISQYHVGVH